MLYIGGVGLILFFDCVGDDVDGGVFVVCLFGEGCEFFGCSVVGWDLDVVWFVVLVLIFVDEFVEWD